MSQARRPNWVKERAECNLGFVFAQLCKEIKDDLEEMRAYSSVAKYPGDLRVRQDENVLLIQTETQMQAADFPLLRIERGSKSILIRRPGGEGQVVESHLRAQWNADQDRCDLLYEGTPLAYWEVCKRVLEPIFFETPE